jgi:FkbM family methyltransferase
MNMDKLEWLGYRSKEANELYHEVIVNNSYAITPEICKDREFIDIGANMGMFSILASTLGASKVIAIEPVSSTVEILEDNIEQAGIHNIFVHKNIVSNVSGETVKIGLQDKCGHNSVYSPSEDYEEVKTIYLKDILNILSTNNIFLKIDCEGGEYDILLNADFEDMARITSIAIEIHGELHPTFKGFWHIHKALYSFGYKPIQQNQLKSWNVDQFGNAFNICNLPVSEEIWIRNE